MVKAAAIDVREFARFFLTGIAAASGNVASTYLVSLYESFELSLLAGIAAGLVISFTLSKWFAFGSRSWRHTGREGPRFLVVYATSSAVYWIVAVAIERFMLAQNFSSAVAETFGILFGAGTMTLTSYFGHRFFTYRTHRRVDVRVRHTS